MTEEKIRPDKASITVTVLVTVLMLFIVSLPIWCSLSMLSLAIPSLIISIAMYAYAPVSVCLTADSVVIKRLLASDVRISYSDIDSMRAVSNPDLSWRLFASGGFMGHWGLFRSRALGKFIAFVGKKSGSILVMRKQNIPVIFSCSNSEAVLKALKQHIA